jgi:hypothetical protein
MKDGEGVLIVDRRGLKEGNYFGNLFIRVDSTPETFYHGLFKEDHPDGEGEMIDYRTGITSKGYFNPILQGPGIKLWRHMDCNWVLTGTFQNGQLEGAATLTASNGQTFYHEYKEDSLIGETINQTTNSEVQTEPVEEP